jgi:hypothetical protein
VMVSCSLCSSKETSWRFYSFWSPHISWYTEKIFRSFKLTGLICLFLRENTFY